MEISISTNPPKINDLPKYLSSLKNFDIDYVHVDVMDGVLVEAKTFDADFLPKIREVIACPLDVHLMVQNPQDEYKKFVQKGVDCIAVHYECFQDNEALISVLKDIRERDIKASIAIKIETPITADLLSLLKYCDRVLVMSVKIGKSGQTFDQKACGKIDLIKKHIDKNNLKTKIEVDGGVTSQIAHHLKTLGVSIIVVGGYLYKSLDKETAIFSLK